MRIILAFLILSVLCTGAALAQNVYVANGDDTTVSIFFDTDRSTITVDVGIAPSALAVSPDGDFVYAAGPSKTTSMVAVIRTSDNTVVDMVNVFGLFAGGIAVTPDGSHLYVTNSDSDNVSVIQTSDNTIVATVGVGKSPIGVAISVDGAYVFVANTDSDNVSVIQTSDNTVVATVDVGEEPFGVTTNAATTGIIGVPLVFVTNSGSNNMSVFLAETPFNHFGLNCGLFVDVGESPAGVAGANTGSADFGLVAYVANSDSNTVSIISLSSCEVIGTQPVGQAPVGIAATPEGDAVYVVNSGSNTLSAIGMEGVSVVGDTGKFPVAVAIGPSEGLEGPDPEPMGDGNGSSSNSCALASQGAAPSFPLYLLIPAFILINRFWRRRTN